MGGGVAPVWSWLNTPAMLRRPGAAAGILKGVVMADNQQANHNVKIPSRKITKLTSRWNQK